MKRRNVDVGAAILLRLYQMVNSIPPNSKTESHLKMELYRSTLPP
jgi:hypothetical protein